MHSLSKLPAGNLPTDQPSHAPYWILPTRQVNDFVTADISRWVYCLEAIITTADAAMNGSITTPQEEQLANGVMVSALIRILCMVCGAGPAFYSAVWRKGKRKRVQEDDRDSLSEFSD